MYTHTHSYTHKHYRYHYRYTHKHRRMLSPAFGDSPKSICCIRSYTSFGFAFAQVQLAQTNVHAHTYVRTHGCTRTRNERGH